MIGLVDVDARMLARDPETLTALALAVEIAMLRDPAARAAYERIYGVSWESGMAPQEASC